MNIEYWENIRPTKYNIIYLGIVGTNKIQYFLTNVKI